MTGPPYHGRTHTADGTDPIPGLGGGGSGIQFEIDPQEGDWLTIVTTGTAIPGGGRGNLELKDEGGGGVFIHEDAGGGIMLKESTAATGTVGTGGIQLRSGVDGIALVADSSGPILLDARGDLTLAFGGNLISTDIPTADPSVTGAVWADSGVLVLSGSTVPGGGGSGIDFGTNTGTALSITTTTGGIELHLPASQEFNVYNDNGDRLLTLADPGYGYVQLDAGQTFDISPIAGGTVASFGADGYSIFQLGSAQAFEVRDSGGNPIFRVDEDGDLHGKTGKALVFDL